MPIIGSGGHLVCRKGVASRPGEVIPNEGKTNASCVMYALG